MAFFTYAFLYREGPQQVFQMRDFLKSCTKDGIQDFKAKCMGTRFGIESMFRMWDANNNRWDYGIELKFGSG